MIWLSWRQFRTQALVGAVLLAGYAIFVLGLGREIHHTYDGLAGCRHRRANIADIASDLPHNGVIG